jgi:hypothetical protein
MPNRLDQILAQIKLLERELVRETGKKEAEFSHRIQNQTVRLTEAAKARNRQFRQGLGRYTRNSRFSVHLVDVVGSLYQDVASSELVTKNL